MKTLIAIAFLCAPMTLAGDTVTTPEPASVVLLGAGLAGIGFAAWRRNRKR